ncbi:hypothetical protein EDI_289550 [Entamoeba dispar SAW760]|uniref:Auxin efflux carrier family protein n=1 Tax=Entamoeba dispar (strain ATCC PRA-260 / SAW760) TaxID=370354 RepID=B0EVA9_ENTDS|nr:uncharacterized protein EDI_289550 [Entamoeba dispar SAW760]EDR21521.1 hypothetical protein EDI_289550 [Entamoeba dispar SAW760]|eukprot:EDR21521.1 hypothetical protein EDI_289550 [Entamoeba dispar SAW760]
MEITTLIKCSIYSIIKLVFIALMGFIASRCSGFDERMRGGWSKLIFTYFMPAIVFYQTATAIDEIKELKELWILPVACLIHGILQFFIPLIIGFILRISTLDNRVFSFTLGFANVMYIPMAIVEALTNETDELGNDAKNIAFSYICTYQLTFMITFFVLGYNYINFNVRDEQKLQQKEIEMKEIKVEKDDNELKNENIFQENNNNNENHQSQPNNIDNSMSVSNEHVHETNGATISNSERRNSLDDNYSTKQKSKQRCSSFTQPFINCYKLLKKIGYYISQPFIKIWMKLPEIIRFSIKNLFSIPTMAAILGVIFMLIKPVRDPLLVSGNWSIIGRCISYLGSCTVFCALFLLGGALSNGPRGGTISTWKIMIGIIARMVITPTICWVATYLLYKYEILPSNKVMYFVLQIESFAPPALNSLVVVNVCYPNGTNSTSTILFWSYMLAIISLTVDIIITMTTLDN